MPTPKSVVAMGDISTIDQVGRSYYIFCLETALAAIVNAHTLVTGDPVEDNHELPLIETLITTALEAS